MDIWVSIQNDVLLNSTFYFYITEICMHELCIHVYICFTGEGIPHLQ